MIKTATYLLMFAFLLSAITIQSCQKENLAEEEIPEQYNLVVQSNALCGYEKYDLLAGRVTTVKVGELEVANDNQNLYIEITPTDTAFRAYQLFVGSCNLVRSDSSSAPNITQYPLQGTLYSDSALVTVPLSSIENCFCIVAVLSQPRNGGGSGTPGTPGGNGSALLVDYCKQTCVTCNSDNIFGQGGWGAKPAGNNPGTHLAANFSTWFPNGITVGCASGKTLKLTSANAVTTFLPQGGTPNILSQNFVNPTARITVLAGQLVALTINVASNPSLGTQVITSGPFAGRTVNSLLAEVNEFFGGCRSGNASQYNEALEAINSRQAGIVSCD